MSLFSETSFESAKTAEERFLPFCLRDLFAPPSKPFLNSSILSLRSESFLFPDFDVPSETIIFGVGVVFVVRLSTFEATNCYFDDHKT
jgi:hypothetical protein